jgi:hypothetical protein
MWRKGILVGLGIALSLLPFVVGHHDEAAGVGSPIMFLKITLGIVVFIALFVFWKRDRLSEINKQLFFWILLISVLASTLYLVGNTIYENRMSETEGPVHWHADYQVWYCGARLDLVDPRFPSNKIGSPLFHEHNDDRMHIEGTVQHLEDIDLGSYFEVIGGKLGNGEFRFPSVDGEYYVRNGDYCADDTIGRLKVYVNGQQIEDFEHYLIYPDSYVPPGDCLMIVFDADNSTTTSKLCESWQVRGWDYANFKRRSISVGGHRWQ